MSVLNRYSLRSLWWLAIYTAVTLAVFWVAYPTHFLIADEVAYLEQALEWGSASPSTDYRSLSVVSDYPPGTALLASGFIVVFGPKAVFATGITAWLAGIWALALLLHRLGKPIAWALYPALFLPGILLTRTLMSDLPSFALASIFLWLYTNQPIHQSTSQPINQSTSPPVLQSTSQPTNQSTNPPILQSTSQPTNQSTNPPILQSTAFAAGFVAGIGLLFRETNLLWALPFLAGAAWRGRAYWKTLWLGFAAGAALRLAWGWLCFGNPAFVRDSGIAFSLSFLPQNLGFYLFALLVLAPGGLYFLIKNQSPYRWEIAAAAVLFLGVYGCYGYDAFAKSGIKGLVLQGRFLLPLMPFMAMVAAETTQRLGQKVQIGMGATALALFVGVQMLGHAYNTEQQRITDSLLQLPAQTHLTFTPDESRKYLNALHGNQTLLVPTQNSKLKTQNYYAHLITRSDSADRLKKTAEAEAAFQHYFRGRETMMVMDLTIRDGTRLRIWRFGQPDLNE